MALVPWYLASLYENGQMVAWVRNAQDIDEAAESTPAIGREYYYANLSATRTMRVRFVTRSGSVEEVNVPPNTPETHVRLPAAYNNYDGWREIGWA